MRAGATSRALGGAFGAAVLLTVLLAGVPTSRAGFSATTANTGNSFVAEGWKAILAIDGGQAHACLARSEGSVWCWGLNDRGQLGDTTTTDRWTPVQVTGPGGSGVLTDVIDLAGGSRSTCAARAVRWRVVLGPQRPRPAGRRHDHRRHQPGPGHRPRGHRNTRRTWSRSRRDWSTPVR